MTWSRARLVLTTALIFAAAVEYVRQLRDDAEIRAVADEVTARAGATTPRARALALCHYIRATVSYIEAPHDDRPFLRATAAETLASGRGYCGEVTRAFIELARASGIPAQRVNLYGRTNHVVAAVDLGDGQPTLFDCQQPPHIPDPATLDEVMRRLEFDSYSTLNLRRVGLGRLVPRLQLELGTLTRLSENPHLLKATACVAAVTAMWAAYGLRRLVRAALRRRGWVHLPSLEAEQQRAAGVRPLAGPPDGRRHGD